VVDVDVLAFRLLVVLVLPEFMTLGVPAYAVGCLPAPLSLGLRQKAAEDFPSAPLTQKQQQQPWPPGRGEAMPKRSLKGQGALWRRSIEVADAKGKNKNPDR